MPDFGEVREQPCERCGCPVIYQGGNWYCGGIYGQVERPKNGCGWSTARDCESGRLTLEHCPRPRCGGRIVYNGNYFCEFLSDGCDWALPHPARSKADRELALRLTGETH